MKSRIRIARGTSAARSVSTEVPAEGQPVYETDTRALYVGDGTTQLKNLKPVHNKKLICNAHRIVQSNYQPDLIHLSSPINSGDTIEIVIGDDTLINNALHISGVNHFFTTIYITKQIGANTTYKLDCMIHDFYLTGLQDGAYLFQLTLESDSVTSVDDLTNITDVYAKLMCVNFPISQGSAGFDTSRELVIKEIYKILD